MRTSIAAQLVASSLIFLSALSTWLVYDGAATEPYTRFRAADAIKQVGLGTAALVLWVEVVALLGFLFWRRRLSRWWLLGVVWAVVVVFYLWRCPAGYVSDIQAFADPVCTEPEPP